MSTTKPPHARCRDVRTAMGKTQKEFADLLGIVPSTIQSIEQGRRIPSGAVAKLIEIAELHPEVFIGKTSSFPSGDYPRGFLG